MKNTLLRKLLLPGEYCITQDPIILETLVGSCVAVCVWNRKNHAAAMNHFILSRPFAPGDKDIGRFGSTATDYIIRKLLAIDADPAHYQAKIYGGAAVLKGTENSMEVGENNIKIALDVLHNYRIAVIHTETGGSRGRRIRFNTENNLVECRYSGDIPRKYPSKESV